MPHRVHSIIPFFSFANRINNNEDITSTLERSYNFYESTLKELIKLEEECEEYILRIKMDLSAAMKSRMQSFSLLCLGDVKRAYRMFMCCNGFDEMIDGLSRCTWEPVPSWSSEDTRNILLKPKEITRAKFDESDRMFKQEIICLRTKMFSLPKKFTESYVPLA